MKREVGILLGKTACILGALSSIGCSTDPGETTAIGAATGGVLGAGLGAIVGNQTGDPGTGLALGTIVGSTTGALIGNSIEAQQRDINQRDEYIERQKDSIRSRRQEIERLRAVDSDNDDQGFTTARARRGNSTFQEPTVAGSPPLVERRDLPRQYKSEPREDDVSGSSKTEPQRKSDQNTGQPSSTVRASAIFAPPHSVPLSPPIEEQSNQVESPAGHASDQDIQKEGMLSSPNSRTSDWTSALQQRKVAGLREGAIKNSPSSREKTTFGQNKSRSDQRDETKKPVSKTVKSQTSKSVILPVKPEVENELLAPPIADVAAASTADEVSASYDDTNESLSQCAKAEEEMMKASATSEPPDKLFHYLRALRLCPANPAYHVKLGDLYLSLKRKSDAQYEFKEALKLDPTYQEAKKRVE